MNTEKKIFRRRREIPAYILRKDYRDGYLDCMRYRKGIVIRRLTGKFTIRTTLSEKGDKRVKSFHVKDTTRKRNGLPIFVFCVYWRSDGTPRLDLALERN